MYDLKGFRQAFNLTQSQLAEMFNCKQSNISGMEKTMRDLEPYQKEILINKYGEASVNKYTVSSFLKDDTNKENINDAYRSVYITYLLPQSAMGGSLTGFAVDGATMQNCEAVISPIAGVDFAITVYGESMSPEYPSGSRILIKKINPTLFIDWGKTYVLDTPNGVIVKEVHECKEKEGYIKCHSINPDPKFSDFDVPLSEIYGMYRVLMCLSAK